MQNADNMNLNLEHVCQDRPNPALKQTAHPLRGRVPSARRAPAAG